MAKDVTQVAKRMSEIVDSIPELRLLAVPDCAIVPITTAQGTAFSIYQVASLLEASGWNMFTGQHPAVMSACIGEQHLRVVEDWAADLRKAVEKLRQDPVRASAASQSNLILSARLSSKGLCGRVCCRKSSCKDMQLCTGRHLRCPMSFWTRSCAAMSTSA